VSSPERTYKTRAIVLRGRNLGEADRIYTLFGERSGKFDAIAKGVRRTKSHFSGRLEFASEVALGLHRGRNLDVITSAEIFRPRWPAIVDPAVFATAHVLVELIDAFCEPELALPEVYALLRGALGALEDASDPATLVPRFQLRLLGILGFAPETAACVRCALAFAGRSGWADLEAGGIACENCRPHQADALALEPADVLNFQALGAERGGPVRPALGATPATARAVDAFVNYHLGKRPKSSKLLDDLASTGAHMRRRAPVAG
jgi:DNA repair protein RecO (recombination protein O)